MMNWDEHVAKLPDPKKDKMPKRVGQLSEEEVKRIRSQKKQRSNRDWSGAGESMIQRILERCFDAKSITKKDDRLQEIVDKNGKVRRFYANWKHPDFSFAAKDINGEFKSGYCEVKSCSPKSSSISLKLKNTLGQMDYMNRLPDDYIKWWALVFWQEIGTARVFILTNERMIKLKEVILPNKAKGNYKGSSIRRDTDFDVLYDCEVMKVKGRWRLPPEHWYAR